ncbi:MAG: hypothetical protein ACWIPJ_09310 [Polaribacter sp.]
MNKFTKKRQKYNEDVFGAFTRLLWILKKLENAAKKTLQKQNEQLKPIIMNLEVLNNALFGQVRMKIVKGEPFFYS